ncbi:transposase [Corynebacterium glutamicum]|uniref:transposase n=1 Tax=Corynebacterium glutamicum TaxID=1718 RepID=UPI0036F3F0F3
MLPATSRVGRPCRNDLRNLANGVHYRIWVGCSWRDIPARYGHWWRIYDFPVLATSRHLVSDRSSASASRRCPE